MILLQTETMLKHLDFGSHRFVSHLNYCKYKKAKIQRIPYKLLKELYKMLFLNFIKKTNNDIHNNKNRKVFFSPFTNF